MASSVRSAPWGCGPGLSLTTPTRGTAVRLMCRPAQPATIIAIERPIAILIHPSPIGYFHLPQNDLMSLIVDIMSLMVCKPSGKIHHARLHEEEQGKAARSNGFAVNLRLVVACATFLRKTLALDAGFLDRPSSR